MKILMMTTFLAFQFLYSMNSSAQHLMQHGFILSQNDTLASHLVANGHHSWQTELMGQLIFKTSADRIVYDKWKASPQVLISFSKHKI